MHMTVMQLLQGWFNAAASKAITIAIANCYFNDCHVSVYTYDTKDCKSRNDTKRNTAQ